MAWISSLLSNLSPPACGLEEAQRHREKAERRRVQGASFCFYFPCPTRSAPCAPGWGDWPPMRQSSVLFALARDVPSNPELAFSPSRCLPLVLAQPTRPYRTVLYCSCTTRKLQEILCIFFFSDSFASVSLVAARCPAPGFRLSSFVPTRAH